MMNRRNFTRPEPSRTNVTAVVKWYNPAKGFGFVQPSDGSPDAFLHASVVEQSGHRAILEGSTIVCDLSEGQKGPQVVEIHSVDASTANPSSGFGGSGGYSGGYGGFDGPPRGPRGPVGASVEGTVKFYNAAKGFGFITPDNGGKDVFVSSRTLERAGLSILETDQRVRVTTRMGQKGPMAESIELA